jgi:hypothetical protein
VYKNKYENLFANIENWFKPLIEELIIHLDDNFQTQFPQSSRLLLSYFFSFLILKNPQIMNNVNFLPSNTKKLSQWEQHNEKIFHIMENWDTLANFICDKYNIIVHKNDTNIPFITASFPSAVQPFGKDDGLFYFPLTPNILIIFEPKDVVGFTIDRLMNSEKNFVNYVNCLFKHVLLDGILISNDAEYLMFLRDNNFKA